MLAIDESVADRSDLQGAYSDGSLKLLRKLAVTSDLNTALPRLSAIVSKMLLELSRTPLHLRIRKYRLEEAATAQWRSSAARV